MRIILERGGEGKSKKADNPEQSLSETVLVTMNLVQMSLIQIHTVSSGAHLPALYIKTINVS